MTGHGLASRLVSHPAAAHTLDVARYLIPAVPMVGLVLSLFAIELAATISRLQRRERGPRPTGLRLDQRGP